MIVNTSSSMDNIKNIQKQFNEIIAFSQGGFTPNTEELFNTWFEAKRDFIESWEGKLIYEAPDKVSFELSQKDKDARLDEFINMVAISFDNEYLAQFLEDNRKGFFQNKVLSPWCNSEVNIEVPEGMKLLKAFKYFESDEITLKDLQTQASMIIQEDKVEGYLCFSVHPLDFLSSSENTYNWRSCHALDGEYRAGNLSYMVDKSTIMCYLRGTESANLPNFPQNIKWNSKKWRMLLFFSEKWDVLFAGRQYPFFSRNALDIIMVCLKTYTPILKHSRWSDWHDDQISVFDYQENNRYDGGYLMWPYVCISNELHKLKDIIIDGEKSPLHFNDLLRSSCYKPYYSFKSYRTIGEQPKFLIGGQVPCCSCGKDHIIAPDTMLCEQCELDFGTSQDERFGYCDCCDRRIVVENGHYVGSNGWLICDWCYNTMIKQCDCCGNDYYNDDLFYDKSSHSYKCYNCKNQTLEQEYNNDSFTTAFTSMSKEHLQELINRICRSEDY